MSCPNETDLGVYVLGTLDDSERAAVDAHVAGCPACRARRDELMPLPALLGRLTTEQVEALEEPPSPLLAERIVAEGRRRATRSRRRPVLLAAAASFVVLAAVAGVTVAVQDGGPPGVGFSVTDQVTHVRAEARLVDHDDGTQVRMSLWGVAPGTRCQIVAVSVDGRREVAATWVATYAGDAKVVGTTAIPRDRLQQLLVRTDAGRVLATMRV